MTRQLRQRHRSVIAVLAVVLGGMFAAGILSRAPVLPPDGVARELLRQTETFSATGYERADLFGKSPVRVRVWRGQEQGSLAVDFSADKELIKPDLLAYWSPSRPEIPEMLPSDARLLGAFMAGPLVLPEEASLTDGSLILFSLAGHEIIDVSKAIRFTDRR
jgi:hypothetical protein